MTRAGLAAGVVAALGAPAGAADMVKGPPLKTPGIPVPIWVPGPSAGPPQALHFESIPKHFGSGQVTLSGGKEVLDANDWRAVAIASGKESCTATLVGPKVVLLAAHCVDARLPPSPLGTGTVPADIVFKTRKYAMQCEMSGAYSSQPVNASGAPRSSDDYALCDLDQSALNEVSPEDLSTAIVLQKNSRVQLMGYGCTKLGISPDGYYTYTPPKSGDHVLRMGQENVEGVGVSIYSDEPGSYVRTLSVNGAPVICYGDSGGPVVTAAPAGRGRRVAAVNSAMGATEFATAAKPAFYSYLSPLSSAAFRTLLRQWSDQPGLPAGAPKKDRRICGDAIPAGLSGCRP